MDNTVCVNTNKNTRVCMQTCLHADQKQKPTDCNPLRSQGTGSWAHDQPSQRASVPPVIQVFEFAPCEGIPCGIVVFAPLLFQCVSVERYTVVWISASVWIPWSSLLFL